MFGRGSIAFGVNDSKLEDKIIRHLAIAATMGRAHHVRLREGSKNRSVTHKAIKNVSYKFGVPTLLDLTLTPSHILEMREKGDVVSSAHLTTFRARYYMEGVGSEIESGGRTTGKELLKNDTFL
ncbi:hypothetical protein Tco_1083888 [Tanacetum coccineum]